VVVEPVEASKPPYHIAPFNRQEVSAIVPKQSFPQRTFRQAQRPQNSPVSEPVVVEPVETTTGFTSG